MLGRKKKRPEEHEKGGIELTGEALHLLRTAPLSVLATYYVGGVPFVLGLLYFCCDMSKSAFADQRCLAAALGLALLFLWMKCWHAAFAQGLTAHITGGTWGPWNITRIGRLAAVQTAIQPYGLILIPVTFILMLPFYCTHGFYQNVTVLGHGDTGNIRDVAKRSWHQAMLWPKQSHMLMWLANTWILGILMFCAFGTCRLAVSGSPELHHVQNTAWFIASMQLIVFLFLPLCPIGWAVAGNVAVLLIALPALSRSLLGMETVFTVGGWHAIFSTTFLVTVYGISYLFLDPLVKSIHVLRCFYGEARMSGEDLLIGLKDGGE